ncbi:hypothetical protein ACX0G7_09625 [Flavitalea antarctica]
MRPNFNGKSLRKYFQEKTDAFNTVILDQMKQVGEEFVRDARGTNTYKDRTRNLRGSIGYVILKNGKQIFGSFAGTDVGQNKAKKVIASMKNEFATGYALIGVAGMQYAAAVEAKGFDVITGSSIDAEASLNRAFKKIAG